LELLSDKINWLLFPLVGESLGLSVVSGESVDSGFDENESVLSVLVFSALLHVSSNVNCLLNQAVDIFRDLGGAAYTVINIEYRSS
jgi:hypothetical protein